ERGGVESSRGEGPEQNAGLRHLRCQVFPVLHVGIVVGFAVWVGQESRQDTQIARLLRGAEPDRVPRVVVFAVQAGRIEAIDPAPKRALIALGHAVQLAFRIVHEQRGSWLRFEEGRYDDARGFAGARWGNDDQMPLAAVAQQVAPVATQYRASGAIELGSP